jgi:hypothetical protein
MKRPEIGDWFSAYFGGVLSEARVIGWRGRWCDFDNGYSLRWGGEHVGFLL